MSDLPRHTRSPTKGKQLSFFIQGIDLDELGNVVYDQQAGPQSLAGRLDRAVRRHRVLGKEVSALDSPTESYLPYKRSWDLILGGFHLTKRFITEPGNQLANPLDELFDAFDAAYVVLTTPLLIAEYWGSFNDSDWPIAPIRNIVTVSLRPINMGRIPNPRIRRNPLAP